jgi:hypothetical protein
MALVDKTLADNLLALYREMETAPMDMTTYAAKMAKILDDQTKTAGVPAGTVIVSVVGQATGTPNAAEIPVK